MATTKKIKKPFLRQNSSSYTCFFYLTPILKIGICLTNFFGDEFVLFQNECDTVVIERSVGRVIS